MRILGLVTIGLAMLGGTAATHTTPAAASAPPSVTIVRQGDSLRAVARWAAACDARGCPDRFLVTWLVNGTARPVRTLTRRIDTLWLPVPPWGDSVRVSASIIAERRSLASPVRSASRTYRRPDAAPPAVESLMIDSARVALTDSISRLTLRAVSGERNVTTLPLGQVQWCTLGLNRYTGTVQVVLDPALPHEQRMQLERDCEPARRAVALGDS